MKKTFFLTTFSVLASFSLFSQAGKFINEVNYLASNPSNRGFEIAGDAGSSLDGWEAVLYNANGTVNQTEDLGSSTIPNQQNGYGAIWYDVDQMGNGGGLALVNPNGVVEQFLSYGGSLFNPLIINAVNGPAAGMTSDFIGKQLLGIASLQLTGVGNEYSDFVWALPLGITPNGINLNQLFNLLPPLAFGNSGNLPNVVSEMEPSPEFLALQTPGEQFEEVVAFPNPATDFMTIRFARELSQDARIDLFDLNGRLVESQEVSQNSLSAEVDLSELQPGEYVLRTSTTGASKLIIKQ